LAISNEIPLPTQFIVERNQSLSWGGNKQFILVTAVLTLGIAVIFAMQGMWLILPFAGFEILALTTGLYLCKLHCREREVITIDRVKVFIESGRSKPKVRWKFDRAWLNVELKKSAIHGYPSRLLFTSKGETIEVGKCLTNKERESLANTIVAVLE